MSFFRTKSYGASNVSREEQFLGYFRDTGAAAALQKAMILLYRMPIKPSNLEEFFAEYLENGAKQLTILSALKAELCYKHSEMQDIHKRVGQLQDKIKSYEMRLQPKAEKYLEPEEPRLSVIEEPEECAAIEWDLMSKFLGDLQDAPRESVTSVHTLVGTDNIMMQDGRFSADTEALLETSIIHDTPEEKCLEKQDSITALKEDLKSLDPWGIVCAFEKKNTTDFPEKKSKSDEANEAKGGKSKKSRKSKILETDFDPTRGSRDSEMSRIVGLSNMSTTGGSSGDDGDDAFNNYDSEDAETLAEMYHTYAIGYDAAKTAEDARERNEIQAPVAGKKLLTVVKPPELTIGSLLGWPPLPCKIAPPEGEEEEESAEDYWFNRIEFIDDKGDEFDPCEDEDFRDADAFWMDFPTLRNSKLHIDDSFLLQKDMSRIAKKFSTNGDDAGFIFDFYKKYGKTPSGGEITKEHIEGFCRTCRKHKNLAVCDCKEEGTMTAQSRDLITCPCGESDCNCNCTPTPTPAQPETPCLSKLTNWRKLQPEDYLLSGLSGEDYDLVAEDENVKCFRKKKVGGQQLEQKASLTSRKSADDVPFVELLASKHSSCNCSTEDSDCVKFCKDYLEESSRKSSDISLKNKGKRNSRSEATMTQTEEQRKTDPTYEKRASGDPEIAKAFKECGGYANENAKKWAEQAIRRSSEKGKRALVEGEKGYMSDAYELNLDKEVKKAFGF